ncbi:MAG: UDP-2,3-diacylglucosamine diphosphatase [Gammaproteobacteria bacterium]|nr:UDP-2,3-diacylglucosamine diphosphatase [Gammaproteobacteria bacterium]
MSTLFISDLHLDSRRPESIERFEAFVRDHGLAAESVYILGDLFEAWVGDDDTDPAMKPVIDGLAALAKAGVECSIMHGNHDFLIGRRFALATGCRLLGDYETIELYGERVLLTHGDLLCTDDVRYLKLRAMLRDPAWQRDFLAKPLAERKAIANELRRASLADSATKSQEIMDVNDQTVVQTMERFGVQRLLHGHTHRPAVHTLTVGGRPAERIVLGAWYEHGYVLRWDENGYRVELI